MSNVCKEKLQNIADVIQGQSPQSIYYSDVEGTPFLQGNRTFGNLYPYYDTYTSKVTKMAKKGDVLMSIRAPVGALNIAPSDLCIGRGLASIRAKNGDNRFVYYALKNGMHNLIKQGAATTFDAVNKDTINNFEIFIPNLEEDRTKVSKLLSALDDKIELNNKINSELEAMARELYEYWFIQFDFPDENGKPYKSSGGKMVWNEKVKREIPEGWKVTKINDVFNSVGGYSFSSDDYVENGRYKLYTIGNVQDRYIDSEVDNYLDFLPDNMPEECLLKPGEMLMSLTGNVGRVGFVYENNALLNQRVLKLESKEGHKAFMYITFIQDSMRLTLERISNGTSQKNLSPINMGKLDMIVPTKDILYMYDRICNPMIEKLINNFVENQKLSELSNFLLPMLMNGQVVVK